MTMSSLGHHGAVPPRQLAATITAQAVLNAGWAVAGAYLFISLVALVSLWFDRHYGVFALLPLAALCIFTIVLTVLIRWPSTRHGILYLGAGTVATFLWVFGLLSIDPILNSLGIYLVNRLVMVLLLVGAVSSRLVHGVAWCTAGWVLGSMATILAQLSLGVDVVLGFGPAMALLIYLVIIVMFELITRNQRRFGFALSSMHVEPARITGIRELEERTVALLHDTVLNDLVTLAHVDDELDERTRTRFRQDIAAVVESKVDSEPMGSDAAVWLRQEILTTVSDFQWRGLRVEITGDAAIPPWTSPQVAAAMARAIQSCLENVVRHSTSDSAELFLDCSEQELSVMIVDHGVGFDTHDVANDRLGIRQSVVQRIENVGGTAKIWSTEGVGTSVVVTVPLGVPHE